MTRKDEALVGRCAGPIVDAAQIVAAMQGVIAPLNEPGEQWELNLEFKARSYAESWFSLHLFRNGKIVWSRSVERIDCFGIAVQELRTWVDERLHRDEREIAKLNLILGTEPAPIAQAAE